MKKIISLFFIIISINNAFSKVYKLDKDEFLKAYDRGKVNFEIMPIARYVVLGTLMHINKSKDTTQFPNELVIQMEEQIKKDWETQFRYYKEEFTNVRYLDYGEWRYFVSFDYATTRKCTLRIEKIDPECGNPICSNTKDPLSHPNADRDGQIIPDSYCEKIYGVKLDKK